MSSQKQDVNRITWAKGMSLITLMDRGIAIELVKETFPNKRFKCAEDLERAHMQVRVNRAVCVGIVDEAISEMMKPTWDI